MSNLVVVSVGFGVIILAIAFFFPTLMAAPSGDVASMAELNTSESADFNGALQVTLTEVDEANESATVSLRDIESLQTDSITVEESSTETATVSGESIDIRLDSIQASNRAVLTVSHPATFGWAGGAVLFAENIHVLLSILAFILCMGFLLVMMP